MKKRADKAVIKRRVKKRQMMKPIRQQAAASLRELLRLTTGAPYAKDML